MKHENIRVSEVLSWFRERNGIVRNFGLKGDHIVSYPRAIEMCDESNIAILTKKYKDDAADMLARTACKVLIIQEELLTPNSPTEGKAFLIHENPKEVLIEFCKKFLEFEKPNDSEKIHSTVNLEEGAKIGSYNHIDANVFISKNSEIGSNCSIGQNTVIKNTSIGDNVKIGANNTIGENGFGYSKLQNGEVELFPHYGRVIIEEEVNIGNNTCIDRGSLSDTIIMLGVKIDNLVHIAHNVKIGKNSLIIACSMIAGSVVIGENSWVAPSSALRNAITIGKNATIGIGSTVTKNVPASATVLGNPAMPIEDFAALRKLQKIQLKSFKDNG